MSRQVLIIHGWSDVSDSFRPLAKFLAGHGYDPVDLWLGDYISLEDDVGVRDVGKRMDVVIKAMIAAGRLNAQFDMVVHSTGGLVARQWIVANYGEAPQTCPVKRLVMLAPANFGSKLAATGKSFLGRIIKGYNNWFETGRTMLENLELASAFQWELASQDLLTPPGGTTTKYYGKDLVWPFVIVGTHPYTGALRQIVNENGSDGTVRACAANLNCTGVTIDFREQEGDPGFTRVWDSRLEHPIPFAVLATRTHATIIDPDRTAKDSDDGIEQEPGEDEMLGELILQALSCQDFEG